MKLTKIAEDRYRGQDGLLYNRKGEVINEDSSIIETAKEALAGLRQGEPSSEQTEG